MKKAFVIIFCFVFFMGCQQEDLEHEIVIEKFAVEDELKLFDMNSYIKEIDPIISDLNYIRKDSVFLDDNGRPLVITDKIIENILSIYNAMEDDYSTYEMINFLDLHISSISQLDLDILLFKIVQKIEADLTTKQTTIQHDQFRYLIVDYITRITDTFIDSYQVTPDVLAAYPDMIDYLEKLKRTVKGGYQIRRYEDQYYLFTDYASFLGRYNDYYSAETKDAVSILMRESRSIVMINNVIQMDNESIAYKINELENYMKKHPNSVYYDMMLGYYKDYFAILIQNPTNIKEVAVQTFHYKPEILTDLLQITERYPDGQMAKLLNEMLVAINENGKVYSDVIINDTIEKINSSY